MQTKKDDLMRFILYLSFLLFFVPTTSIAQPCLFENDTLEGFLKNPKTQLQKACPKLSKDTDIVAALNLVEKYWDKSTSNTDRYSMLSEQNKRIQKRVFSVSEPSKYRIPGFGYERISGDYRYNYVHVDDPEFIQISLQVDWEQEGYQGNMTYVFDLLKESDEWRISIIVY
jgi:hypothetical protein